MKTLLVAGLLATTGCSSGVVAEPPDTTTTTMPLRPPDAVGDLVRFTTPAQVEARRDVLIETIWPDGFPTDVAQLDLTEPAGERIGFAIVHGGHLNAAYPDTVDALVGAGYAVQFLSMPRDDRASFTMYHNELFATHGTAAMAMMLNHIIETVNAFEALDPDAPIIMTGLSGGGWSTHMAAAVDIRIDASYPVAGSLPLFARPLAPGDGNSGDAEQSWAAIYGEADTDGDGAVDTATGAASWLEVYALAALPHGRHQVQILNLNDPCCFGGDAHETYSGWLAETVPGWSIYIDTTNTSHSVSAETLALIAGSEPPLFGGSLHQGLDIGS